MTNAIEYSSPAVQKRVRQIGQAVAKIRLHSSEFAEGLDTANAFDAHDEVFSGVDLGYLEQAANTRLYESGIKKPAQLSLTEHMKRYTVAQRRDAAAARIEGRQVDIDILRDAKAAEAVHSQIRQPTELRNLGFLDTSYWGRVSLDGSLYAIGSSAGVSVFDLRPGRNRRIDFSSGAFDPTFNRDFLVFQGDGTWRASLEYLKDDPPSRIDGEVPGFVSRMSRLGLYQDIGSGPGHDVAIDRYEWSGDPEPSPQDPGIFGRQSGVIRFQRINDALAPTEILSIISVPFHTGFQLSADGAHVVCRLANPNRPNEQVGYAIYRVGHESAELVLSPVRVISGLKGGKAKMMGDYIAFHHAATVDDYASYGFDRPDDPDFQALLRAGTADIYLYNMVDNTVRRATEAGPGRLAWYPCFQEDRNGNPVLVYLQRNANGTQSVMSVSTEPGERVP